MDRAVCPLRQVLHCPLRRYKQRVIVCESLQDGEIKEYMAMSVQNGNTKYAFMSIDHKSQREWYANMQTYLRKWVAEHKDGREDTWTPAARSARDESGVWK